MWWIWVLIGLGIIMLALFAFVIIMGRTMAKMADETNCDRLRRLGERGFYKDE